MAKKKKQSRRSLGVSYGISAYGIYGVGGYYGGYPGYSNGGGTAQSNLSPEQFGEGVGESTGGDSGGGTV